MPRYARPKANGHMTLRQVYDAVHGKTPGVRLMTYDSFCYLALKGDPLLSGVRKGPNGAGPGRPQWILPNDRAQQVVKTLRDALALKRKYPVSLSSVARDIGEDPNALKRRRFGRGEILGVWHVSPNTAARFRKHGIDAFPTTGRCNRRFASRMVRAGRGRLDAEVSPDILWITNSQVRSIPGAPTPEQLVQRVQKFRQKTKTETNPKGDLPDYVQRSPSGDYVYLQSWVRDEASRNGLYIPPAEALRILKQRGAAIGKNALLRYVDNSDLQSPRKPGEPRLILRSKFMRRVPRIVEHFNTNTLSVRSRMERGDAMPPGVLRRLKAAQKRRAKDSRNSWDIRDNANRVTNYWVPRASAAFSALTNIPPNGNSDLEQRLASSSRRLGLLLDKADAKNPMPRAIQMMHAVRDANAVLRELGIKPQRRQRL